MARGVFRCCDLSKICRISCKNMKKRLDRRLEIAYIIGALRRQQVGSPVNPAEDINKILIVFVPLRLFAAGDFFLSVIIRNRR
jgi:hypothetical protein